MCLRERERPPRVHRQTPESRPPGSRAAPFTTPQAFVGARPVLVKEVK